MVMVWMEEKEEGEWSESEIKILARTPKIYHTRAIISEQNTTQPWPTPDTNDDLSNHNKPHSHTGLS